MASFPTPWTIQIEPFLEETEGAKGVWNRHYGPPENVAIYAVSPDTATEPDTPGRDVLVTGLTVLAPPDTTVTGQDGPRPINGYDRISWQGQAYEVDGNPADWNTGPYGWRPGISITIRKADG